MNDKADKLAQVIWEYLKLDQKLEKADLIFVLGSHDTRVADRAAEVFKEGLAPIIVITGGYGKLTKEIWNQTEAQKFRDILIQKGVFENAIYLEEESTNTGENIAYTKKLLRKNNIKANSLILVTKPYKERRDYATMKKQWSEMDFQVTSPNLSYAEYFNAYPMFGLSRDDMIALMVGDLQRIKVYPRKGFQIKQDIPGEVWNAFEQLVKLGYDKYLVK